MTLVAVTTRSKLRGVRFFPAMLIATLRARRQLRSSRGLVRWASVIAGPTEFWTLTVWSGVHELQEFMRSGTHGEVMWRMPRWLRSFWLARWRPGPSEVGGWDGLRLSTRAADEPSLGTAEEEEGVEFVRRAFASGGLTYRRSPLVRRSRAKLGDLGGVVIRIDATPRSLAAAARAVRDLHRTLRADPDVIRMFVGAARFHELYLFAVFRTRAAAQGLVEGEWTQRARRRWGERLWVLEWRPEHEFGHWDGVRMRALTRFRRNASGIRAPVKPRELFIQNLGEMLTVEETLVDEVLPKLREQVTEKHFLEALDEHLEQTHKHAERITEVFKKLKERPQREPSPPLDGLRREHEEHVGEITEPALRDLFCASSAAHTEHLEISAYHSLITLANLLGEPEVVHLLDQNLHEEEEALEKVEKAIPERLVGQLAPT